MKKILLILIAFVAVTATISGLLMISNPDGVIFNLSLSLLDGTPFKNFNVPGIMLAAVVGGINILALFFNTRRNVNGYNWALASGAVVCGWIGVQLLLIHAVYRLHLLYLGIGILIILLAYQLKGKWAV